MLKVYLGQPMMGYDRYSPIIKEIKAKIKETPLNVVFDPFELELPTWTPEEVVHADLSFVRQSTHLICDLTVPSLGGGCFAEIYEAYRVRVPVAIICPGNAYGFWMKYYTRFRVPSEMPFEEQIAKLTGFLGIK